MSGALDHVTLTLVDSFAKAEAFMRWLGERRDVLGVDTETSGLEIESNTIRLIQFGDLDQGWAIPWGRWSGVALEALDKYRGGLVLHNSKFDVRHITHQSDYVWPWDRTDDTMSMAHLIDPLRLKGLKPLAGSLIDPRAQGAQRLLDEGMKDNKWDWASVPIEYPYYWMYAALDPVLTCHLYKRFKPEVSARYAYPYELEMGTTRVIADMERRGARIDPAYCDVTSRMLMDYAHTARDWAMHEYGLVNAGSNMKIIEILESQGIVFTKATKGGGVSLDKEVLESIDHPLADVIVKIRFAEKMANTYLGNFMSGRDANDRLHCNIWTMGTRTARMSVTNPALQTLPRKDPLIRSAFVPSEGNVLITCDYDQIEARLMAHFSKDPGMIAAFGGEDDFFCAIASTIFNTPIDKKDPRRQLTKNTIYGKLYGAGPKTMAATAKVPLEQMEFVVNSFDARFPGVVQMQRQINDIAKSRRNSEGVAYISTPTGRRMVADDDKDYTLTNYLIQCHAAEILKRKIIELDAVGLGEYMILPVHDEIVFDIPADMQEEGLRTIQETMADLTTYAVPITASGDILQTSWGDKYR